MLSKDKYETMKENYSHVGSWAIWKDAGDTVIAVFAMALAGGMEAAGAAYLANLAASVVVAKLGTYAVSKEELLAALEKTGT